jgi:cytochrome bd-type quinol oxidase subunit 2
MNCTISEIYYYYGMLAARVLFSLANIFIAVGIVWIIILSARKSIPWCIAVICLPVVGALAYGIKERPSTTRPLMAVVSSSILFALAVFILLMPDWGLLPERDGCQWFTELEVANSSRK